MSVSFDNLMKTCLVRYRADLVRRKANAEQYLPKCRDEDERGIYLTDILWSAICLAYLDAQERGENPPFPPEDE